MKTKYNPGRELPLASGSPLPYLATYRSFIPKSAVIPIAAMMLSVAGLVLVPPLGVWRPFFAVTELLAIIIVVIITSRFLKKRKEAWNSLDEELDRFIDAANKRYEVTLTETILYALAQGGTTLLSDKNGHLTRIMLESDPETKTTKLVSAENS